MAEVRVCMFVCARLCLLNRLWHLECVIFIIEKDKPKEVVIEISVCGKSKT